MTPSFVVQTVKYDFREYNSGILIYFIALKCLTQNSDYATVVCDDDGCKIIRLNADNP